MDAISTIELVSLISRGVLSIASIVVVIIAWVVLIKNR